MKVTILTAFWQRQHISRVYWAGIHRLDRVAQAMDVRLEVVAAITPGDDGNLALAQSHGAVIAMADNVPLSAKWNAVSQRAQAEHPDFVMILGSDDLMNDTLFRAEVAAMREGVEHSGVLDLYLWDSHLGRAGRWPGYRGGPRNGRSVGAGRFFSRRIMDLLEWRLWPTSEEKSGMDGLTEQRLISYGIPMDARSSETWGGIVLDIKSSQNIWSYEQLTRTKVDATIVRCLFPELALLDK